MCCKSNMEPEVPYQEINFGEISWMVEPITWDILSYFRQTITWTGKTFKLETWNHLNEDDMPVHSEEVPNNVRLEDIQLKLKQAAKKESVEYLKEDLIATWKYRLNSALKQFSSEDKEKVARTIYNINYGLEMVEEYVYEDGEIDMLLQELQNELEDQIDQLVAISRIKLEFD